MTHASRPQPGAIPLPRLSDEAAVEIYLFLEHLFALFDARYGPQVMRFYEQRSRDNLVDPDSAELDDPPF